METKNLVIATDSFHDEGPMFWSNFDGWVCDLEQADRFSYPETRWNHLPDRGYWIPLEHARLISLAPEMAEALREAHRHSLRCGDDILEGNLRAILAKLDGKGEADGR